MNQTMSTFNKQKTFTMNSIQIIKKALQLLGMKKYLGEIEYLYQKRNEISPKISQSLMDRFLNILDEVDKISDTEGIKCVSEVFD